MQNAMSALDPPLPPDEAKRLAALHRLKIMDTPEEDVFIRIVNLAAAVFNVPTALISLVDRDRQWIKAAQGTNISSIPRNISFCSHTILGNEVCLVNDATQDPRFAANPQVTGAPGIRFYAGMPLYSEDGYKVGTFCLIDYVPRDDFGPHQQDILIKIAAGVSDNLALRLHTLKLKAIADANVIPQKQAETVIETNLSLAGMPGRKLHILLAEDSKINQFAASAMLTNLGHEVSVVSDGLEAISATATGKYDLILMDMMMPGVDGPTATREIRNSGGKDSGIYIIALTASASAMHQRECCEAGMNDYLTKPVTRKQLSDALARYAAWSTRQVTSVSGV
jgi:CheY-like chemotaxis protein